MFDYFVDLSQRIDHDWLAANRALGPSLDEDLSVTAQPYVTLTSDTLRLDKNQALLGGLGVFTSYARGKMGTLYWRTAPTIERIRRGRYWAYRVKFQLLISDNPLVQRLVARSKPHFMERTQL